MSGFGSVEGFSPPPQDSPDLEHWFAQIKAEVEKGVFTDSDETITGEWTFSGTPVVIGDDPSGVEQLQVGGQLLVGSEDTPLGGSSNYGRLHLSGIGPFIEWWETDAGTDEGSWLWQANLAQMRLTTRADDGSIGENAFEINRTGTAVDEVRFPSAPVVIGSEPNGLGALKLESSTVQDDGINFGGDAFLYRSGAEELTLINDLVIGGTDPGSTGGHALRVDGSVLTTTAFMGTGGHGSAYAHFSHPDMTGTGQYAVLQNSTGKTFVNAATGQDLGFRINNVDKMVLESGGSVVIGTDPGGSELLRVGGDINVGGNIVGPGTMDFTGSAIIRPASGNSILLRDGGNSTIMELTDGGDVIIGTDPGGSEALRVGGSARIETAAIFEAAQDQLQFEGTTDIYWTRKESASLALAVWSTGSASWLFQVEDGGDVLAPSGDLIVGSDPGGSKTLRVGGGARFNDDVRATNGGFEANEGSGTWFDATVTDDSNSRVFRTIDSGGNEVFRLQARDFDGAGGGFVSVEDVGSLKVGAPSDGAVVNIVHHGTGSASAVGVDGTLHTEDA